MKISTKGRYGLKAMFDLSLHYGDGPIALSGIAERQSISLNYLEQLISPLRKSGLVKSVRGAQGGYMLAKAPDTISVGDILRTLEGPIAPADCVSVESDDCCNAEHCVTKVIYERIRDSINEVVNSITLQDMLEDNAKHDPNLIVNIKCL